MDWRAFSVNHRAEWLHCLRKAFEELGGGAGPDGRVSLDTLLGSLTDKLPEEEVGTRGRTCTGDLRLQPRMYASPSDSELGWLWQRVGLLAGRASVHGLDHGGTSWPPGGISPRPRSMMGELLYPHAAPPLCRLLIK